MRKEDLLKLIEASLRHAREDGRFDIQSFGRVDGEDAIGVETRDGAAYFIAVQDA